MENKKVEIPVSGLFSKAECLWFLSRDFDDCMYSVFEDRVRRGFRQGSGIMIVDIYPMSDKLILEWLNISPSAEDITAVVQFVSEWFDLNTDLIPFYKTIAADRRISYMAEDFAGLRFIGMPDFFEALAWCIIGQQINLSFAYKVKRRLVERYGTCTQFDGQKYYLFPGPEIIAKASISDLRELQFSEKKAEYIIAIAEAFLNGMLNKELLQRLPDLESRIKFLTNIRGIGQWTANYALMKSLKEPACIPYGDAGLLNALLNHGIIKSKDNKPAIAKFFKAFEGWQSYIVFYLWRALSKPKE
ncbi:DNA-3-methyladenine glycosylase family protein [Pedobacter heparinus]|uniref:DNA-3-methyladenine glycosylase II n=1 Tax=Pedobacter heparinus (strain ATCC 13125 / DSM 2366 / CIP 104194 / JCM 7457 / NBRC 12017 / NCIMB 9290 / NRRL B-14731 / HIM 762-3) TaxID=485917 RepID=C6XZ60_PEDHD|nr:DNA-3-methyladenine glycosylase [Pedobacter heparinus]ACU02542.1 HhH-GPD family protein [Pedobacter heparinus DSM 2366]